MNQHLLINRIIWSIVLVALLGASWLTFVSRSFLQIELTAAANHVTVTDGQTGRIVSDRTDSGWANVPTGDYVITFLQGERTLSLQTQHVGPLSFHRVAPTTATTDPQTARPFLKRGADLLTPFAGGYLYIDKSTRGLSYLNGTTVTDLSSRVRLTADSNLSLSMSAIGVANAIVGIHPVSGGGVVVVTTRNVFWLRGLSDITVLPIYGAATLNYTASTYDAVTNSIFVLPSYSATIYRYDLGHPTKAPSAFYQASRQLNRITAGGGKLVAYYDAVVNTDAKTLSEYSRTRQVAPLIIDINNISATKQLEDYQAITYASLSADGHYLAMKRKFATALTIYEISNGHTVALPAFDLAGASWSNNTLFLARANAIWSYTPGSPQAVLTRVADTTAPVTWLWATERQIVFSDNNDISYLLQSTTAKPPAVVAPPSPPATLHNFYYAPPLETN